MELTLVGLQYSGKPDFRTKSIQTYNFIVSFIGKTTFVNVIAVSFVAIRRNSILGV